jgi:hypothetical protein
MVLKIIQMTAFEAARYIAALSVISTFIWSVGGFIAFMIWNTYRSDVIAAAGIASREDVARVELALTDAATSFATLSRQIVILSRPDNIALYREPPRVVNGCEAGSTCTISIFAERSPRALECRIIGSRTELLLLAEGREYVATPSPQRQVTNLDNRPRALEPTFQLPRGIPRGPATAIIRSYYGDCAWQINGEPPAIQDSPPFIVEVK